MTKAYRLALLIGVAALSIGATVALPHAQAQAIPVFDAANYAQNLTQAARALDQINNQVRSLQNEASMLQNMAKNLATIDFPQLQRLTSAMQRINQLMDQARGIDFKVDQLDERIRALFPGELRQALTSDQHLREARAQLDASMSSYRQAMRVQAQVASNVEEDGSLLSELAHTSQGSAGALQAAQAGNQLLALSVKQQLQLQNLLASEFRDQSLERARRVQAEEDGRAATERFLGLGAPQGN